MSLDHVEIPMESPSYERLQQLLNLQFSSSDNRMQDAVYTANRMSYMLYHTVRDKNADVNKFLDTLEEECRGKKLDCFTILHQATPTGDSLLHVAAEFGKKEIAELLVRHTDLLPAVENFRGQTSLHVAAKAKNIEVMKVILSKFKDKEKDDIIMSTDMSGNTALHYAILNKHREGVNFILIEQSERSKLGYWGTSSAKSPIYLAVQMRDEGILSELLKIPLPEYRLLLGYKVISPVFAAISERKADLLQMMVDKRDDLMYLVDDKYNNPLHYAARIGFVQGVRILLRKSTILAFQTNSNNDLPIHLACQSGHALVVDILLNVEWSNTTFEPNEKGQNILHIAAMSGQNDVVKYLLRNTNINREIINARDVNGDTPLHLAARKSCLWSLLLLSRDNEIDVNIVNNESLTARDVLRKQSEIRMVHHKFIADEILKGAGVPLGANVVGARRLASTNKDWNVKEAANTLMLVAILIATVTFAAGFTIPGGVYASDDKNQNDRKPKVSGMSILAHQTLFKIFIIFNMVAMYSSIVGCVILMWLPLGDRHFAERVYKFAMFFVSVALITMPVAFVVAVRLVVSINTMLGIVTNAIGYTFISLILFAGILGNFPLEMRLPFGDLFIWITLVFFYGWNDILIDDEDGEIDGKHQNDQA